LPFTVEDSKISARKKDERGREEEKEKLAVEAPVRSTCTDSQRTCHECYCTEQRKKRW